MDGAAVKRKIAFVICLVLVISVFAGLFSYSRAEVDYRYIRVKISIGTTTSFSFFVDGNYSVSGQMLDRQLYTVRIDGSQLKLCLGDTTVAQGSTIEIIRHQGTPGRNNFIWLNNSEYGYLQYLGDMVFSIDSGAIQLVNRIPLEEYLYGVVPNEMGDSFLPEALKSQAVAARSFAAYKMSSSRSYDLRDTVDQVYKGYDASKTNSIAAVNETVGQVLKSGGKVIEALFSASNGGMTDIPYHRWKGGADYKYYVIQEDPYDLANQKSPYETIFFPVTIDASHPVTSSGNAGTPNTTVAVNYFKTAILNSGKLAGYGVTNINQFELSGVTSLATHTHESPASTNGKSDQDHSRMPPGTKMENICIDKVYATGSFIVTIFPVGAASASAEKAAAGEPVAEGTPAASEQPVASEEPAGEETPAGEAKKASEDTTADEAKVSGEEASASVDTAASQEPAAAAEPPEADAQAAAQQAATADAVPAAAGTRIEVNGVDIYLRHLNGSDGDKTWKAFQSTSLGVLVVDPVYDGSTLVGFNLSQRRYGHACGLSQRGAEQRAKDGHTYDNILAFYYPGTTLEPLYGSVPPLTAPGSFTDYTNGTVVNVTTSVNVRSGPSTGYSLLGTLPAGARLELMEADIASDWYMFNYGGKAAYIHRNYVQVDADTLISTMFIRRRGEIYVTPKTTCSALLNSFKPSGGTVTIRNASGAVISGSALMENGSTVTLTDGSGNLLDRLTVRVTKGDVDGDGRVTTADYTLIRLHILHLITLDSYGVQMADINEDGAINIADYTLLRLYLLGLWNLS